jgi:hypothetical protein
MSEPSVERKDVAVSRSLVPRPSDGTDSTWSSSATIVPDRTSDSEDEETMVVTPKKDKGKGKMRYLPEMPEEVWQRIWAFYYGQCAAGQFPPSMRTFAVKKLITKNGMTKV